MTSEQVRAARALLRWEQKSLANAAGISLGTIKRLETKSGLMSGHPLTIRAIQHALEVGGIEFIPENGGGAGVRLKRRNHQPPKASEPEVTLAERPPRDILDPPKRKLQV